MSNATPSLIPSDESLQEPREGVVLRLFAAFLSYLIPGLGQIAQGRIAKGFLFFICLYGMFFAGMAMGDWKNVYIANTARDGADRDNPWQNNSWHLPKVGANLYNRLHYVGQFWIGMAAWPALLQYNENAPSMLGDFQKTPQDEEESVINRERGKLPDIAWIYTVIAGVLNILVIYDAFAGPAFVTDKPRRDESSPESPRLEQETAAP